MTILVIKLGALGDFVFATSAFKALREHYKTKNLVLLTTSPHQEFAQRLGYFDQILLETRPKWYQLAQIKSLVQKLRSERWEKVYDFQGVDRTRLYRYCLLKGIKWVGHPSQQTLRHSQDRFELQLKREGITFCPKLDLTALADPLPFTLPQPYVLLIPGASLAHQGKKCWPEQSYAKLAESFNQRGIMPVIIGGGERQFPLITNLVPSAIDLVGKTSIYQVIGLGQKAALVVGNDTGPTLLAASGGCPTLTLYSSVNPPSLSALRGKQNFSLQKDNLVDLDWREVEKKSLAIMQG